MTNVWRRSVLLVAAFVMALVMATVLAMAPSAEARAPRMECPHESDVPALDFGVIRPPKDEPMPVPCGPGLDL